MAIIANLDVVLAQKKVGVTELSEKVDITIANISILESGKAKAIRFSTPEKICQVSKCRPDDLLTYKNGSNTTPEEQNKVGQTVNRR